jgi:hypothetical protein
MIDPVLLGLAGTLVATSVRVVIHFADRHRRRPQTQPESSESVTVTVERVVRVVAPDIQSLIVLRLTRRAMRVRTIRSTPTAGAGWTSGRPNQ